MPKLLSRKEVMEIGTKMTEEYGLAPPEIVISNYNGSYDSSLKVLIGRNISKRVIDWFPWWKKDHFVQIRDVYADNFESALTQLQFELSKFDARTKIAEQFREKYAMQEADVALDEVLRNETPTK